MLNTRAVEEGTTESGAAVEIAKEEVAKGVALEGIKASASPPGGGLGRSHIEPSQKEDKEQQKATKKAKTTGPAAGSALSFRALVLIGVAAAICGAAIPQMTAKPRGASKPPEAQYTECLGIPAPHNDPRFTSESNDNPCAHAGVGARNELFAAHEASKMPGPVSKYRHSHIYITRQPTYEIHVSLDLPTLTRSLLNITRVITG